MSFTSRLGSIAKDLAGAAVAGPKFLWDVVNAPWNDDEQFNGFTNTLKNAAAKGVIAQTKPLVNLGETALGAPGVRPALETTYEVSKNVLQKPITTIGIMSNAPASEGIVKPILNFFNPNEYKKAWNAAEEDISLGQAFGPGALASGKGLKEFNIYDPSDREDAYSKNLFGKVASGTLDVGKQFTLDVLNVAGIAGGALKASKYGVGAINNADDAAKAAEDITRAQIGGEKNRFTKPLEDFAKNDSIYALNHPMVKSSSNPTLLAHLLGDSKDVQEVGDVLRSALGDPAALRDLSIRRADMADAIKKARGDFDAVQAHQLYAAPEGSGFLPFINDNPAVINEARENLLALARNDRRFAEMIQLGRGGGTLNRTTGTMSNVFDSRIAEGRAAKFYDKNVGDAKVEFYQPTPYHKLYQKVSWAAGERPAGVADFNDPDSYKEITATLNRVAKSALPEKAQGVVPTSLRKLDALEQDEAAGILRNYIAASTPEARSQVVADMEQRIVRRLAAKHGVDDEVARELYAEISGARKSAMDSIKNNGFMVDVDGSPISVPQFESQTANYMPIMDFELLDKLLRRNASSLNLIRSKVGRGADTFVHAADVMQDLFKAGALLRLGYTIRNGVDSQARIASSVGALASLQFLGEGLKDVIFNTNRAATRLIDNYKPAAGEKITYAKIADNNNKLIKKINEGTAKVAELQKQVKNNPEDIMLATELNTAQDILKEQKAIYEHNTEVLTRARGAKQEPIYPNVKDYKDGGKGGLPDTKSVVGFVDTKYLAKMPGNAVDEKGVNFYREKLRSGKGFDEPLMVIYDNETGLAYVGEGNHRLQAAILENTPYVPVRIVRGRVDAKQKLDDKGIALVAPTPGRKPMQVKNDKILPFTTGGPKGPVEYMPTDVHPSFIFDKKYVVDKDLISKGGKPIGPKKTIGEGMLEFTAMDGSKYQIPDAFGGKLGPMFRENISSARTYQNAMDSNYNLINKNFTSKGIGAVKPGDVNYFDAWAQTLNDQFANSAVIQKFNEGKSVEEVIKWLRGTPEGRDLRRRLAVKATGNKDIGFKYGLRSEDVPEYVTRINNFYDTYLPEASGLRSNIGKITPNDLRQTFKDPTTLPVIHGNVVKNNFNLIDAFKYKAPINALFKLLGSMPEDAWARHPLYVTSYRQEVKRRLDLMEGLNKRTVTPAEQNEIMMAAHKAATKQVKEVLYNIERRTNLAAALKYVSPFFSAQENAYKTWGKLAVAHPGLVNRGNQIWNAPNREGLVTDENNNVVPEGKTSGNDVIWVQVPRGFTKLPFVGGGLESMNQMGIPKQSLDIIFQGGMDVLYNQGEGKLFSDVFPVGPYVAMPINNIAKDRPDLEEAFKWALPYGTTRNDLAALQPAWYKRYKTQSQEMDNAEYGRTWQTIWNTEQTNARKEGRAPVSAETIDRMTKDYYKMRLVANLILPFAPKFNSPYRFYMDKYREYRRQGNIIDSNGLKLNPDQRFLRDFPEYFQFAQSLSENKTNVQSSVAAYKNIQDNKSLVGKLNGVNPSMIGLVVNDPKGYEFSQTAYNWLYNQKVAPGSKETFLGTKNPVEAQQQNEAKKGWILYTKNMDTLDAQLKKRGLTSYTQKGAEDLAFLKSVIIDRLSKNPDGSPSAWYIDYKDTDGAKTIKAVEGLKLILSDQKFMDKNANNPMWKSVSLYLDVRSKLAEALAKRPDKSLTAKSNADIKYIYDTIVTRMKNENDNFKDLYERYLSQDPIYDKFLTPKAVK